jgi:hypothetical protein
MLAAAVARIAAAAVQALCLQTLLAGWMLPPSLRLHLLHSIRAAHCTAMAGSTSKLHALNHIPINNH